MATDSLQQTIDKTAREFLLSYRDASAQKEPELLVRALAPDCTRQLAPSSYLAAVGLPPGFLLTNDMYKGKWAEQLPAVIIQSTDILSLVVDAASLKAAAIAAHNAQFSDGEVRTLEFAYFLDFSEDGSKIAKILQFSDTDGSLKFQVKVDELLGKAA